MELKVTVTELVADGVGDATVAWGEYMNTKRARTAGLENSTTL